MDRVLIVNREPGIRGLVGGWSEALGCAPAEAANAEMAIEALARAPFEIAVCDVDLPGRDGLWLARHVRQHYPDTAVLLVTASRDVETAVGGLRTGIVDYLLKPFDRERFREAIDRARQWQRAAAATGQWRRAVELELATRCRQLTEAIARLDLSSDAAVRGALGLLTVRDRGAYEHALRVAALTLEIAAGLGLSRPETSDLERAALLHEVARTVVPETILWKPGALTNDEWAILRREPDLAYELFCGIPLLSGAAVLLRALRERHDGSGYPRGLSGDAIPAGALVLAVADAYETMIRVQGHRDPLTSAEAAAEMLRGRGTQFAPRTADTLLGMLGHAPTAALR